MNVDTTLDIVEYGLVLMFVVEIGIVIHVVGIVTRRLREIEDAKKVDYTDSKWWP